MPCVICGVKTDSFATSDEAWYKRVRFIHYDRQPAKDSPLSNEVAPCVTALGKVQGRRAYLFTGHPDGESVNLPTRLMCNRYEIEDEPDTSCAFPVHEACWEIFCSISGFPPDEYPLDRVDALFKVFGSLDLGIDFDDANETEGAMGLAEWALDDPAGILPLDCWFTEPDYWAKLRIDNLPVSAAEIPDVFSSLPNELIEKILSYLDTEELLRLTRIQSVKKIEVPDIIWRRRFDPMSELGFFIPNTGGTSNTLSWYSLCVLSTRYIDRNFPSVRSRQCTWNFCQSLTNLIDDIVKSSRVNLKVGTEYPFMGEAIWSSPVTYTGIPAVAVTDEFPVVLRADSLSWDEDDDDSDPTDCFARGMVTSILAEEIAISYCGDRHLRYPCGIRFLPSGKGIGLIHPRNEIRVNLKSKNSLAIMIAIDDDGVSDISIGEDDGRYHWIFGGTKIVNSAITKRVTRSTENGMRFSAVAISMNVCRIRRLGLFSPDFKQPDELGDNETALQGNLWMGGVPTIDPTKSVNASSYYDSTPKNVYGKPIMGLERQLAPLSFIDWSDKTVTGFTIRIDSSEKIVGLTVRYEAIDNDDDGPREDEMTLGQRTGEAIDFPIRGDIGERIKYVEFNTVPSDGIICSLSVHTTFNRALRVRHEDPQNMGYGYPALCPPPGSMIVGLFCRFHGDTGALCALGCISTKDPNPPKPFNGIKPSKVFAPPNMKWISSAAFDEKKATKVWGSGVYSSYATFDNCKKIIGYGKPWQGGRLTGIMIYYYGEKDNDLRRNPIILGQPSIGEKIATFDLDLENKEEITEVHFWDPDVHTFEDGPPRRSSSGPNVLIGLKFLTSLGRSFWLGDRCNNWYKLSERKHMVWNFDSANDKIYMQTDEMRECERDEVDAME